MDLSGLKYFLGIEVARSGKCIFLLQRKCVRFACRSRIDRLQTSWYPNYSKSWTWSIFRYTNRQRKISKDGGKIDLFVTYTTWHCICCEYSKLVHVLYTGKSYEFCLWILHYLKGSLGKGLLFSKNEHLNIEGFIDVDWTGNVVDQKSTSWYFTFTIGNLVTWKSKKQNVVALSTVEAEFRGMSKGLCELL